MALWGFSPKMFVNCGKNVLKYCLYKWRKPQQSVKIWWMMSCEKKQWKQVGSAPPRSKCICVTLEWPIRRRVSRTSLFRHDNEGQRVIVRLIWYSLLFVCILQCFFQLLLMRFLIVFFRSECGIEQFRWLQARLAAYNGV